MARRKTKKKTPRFRKLKLKKQKGGCLPCAAAAGPPGIAVAAVGTIGYGAYKYTKKGKISKRSKQNFFLLLRAIL